MTRTVLPGVVMILVATLVALATMEYRCWSIGGEWWECYGHLPSRYHRPMDGGGWKG